jgi:hypothetical protein
VPYLSAIRIIPQYRTLFEREIAAIVPGIAERSQLGECIHEALETTAGDLKKSWGIAVKEQARERNDSGGPAYPIPDPWPETGGGFRSNVRSTR